LAKWRARETTVLDVPPERQYLEIYRVKRHFFRTLSESYEKLSPFAAMDCPSLGLQSRPHSMSFCATRQHRLNTRHKIPDPMSSRPSSPLILPPCVCTHVRGRHGSSIFDLVHRRVQLATPGMARLFLLGNSCCSMSHWALCCWISSIRGKDKDNRPHELSGRLTEGVTSKKDDVGP
jgi:hypothetical protein